MFQVWANRFIEVFEKDRERGRDFCPLQLRLRSSADLVQKAVSGIQRTKEIKSQFVHLKLLDLQL